MTRSKKHRIGGPDDMRNFWYPFSDAVSKANQELRDLLVELQLRKLKASDIVLSDNVELVSGFYPVEVWGNEHVRWTNGNARLRLSRQFLVGEIVYLCMPNIRSQVKIVAYGNMLCRELVRDASWHRLRFDLPSVVRAIETVDIVTDTWNPSLALGADKRELGIAIKSIRFYGEQLNIKN